MDNILKLIEKTVQASPLTPVAKRRVFNKLDETIGANLVADKLPLNCNGLDEDEAIVYTEIINALNEAYTYPAYTADIVATFNSKILLIKRKKDPFKGQWALPGGFVDPGENAEQAAKREMIEETGVKLAKLTKVGVWDKPGRDPRGEVITTAFLADLREEPKVRAGDDAKEAKWWPIGGLPNKIAFDHLDIIRKALVIWSKG